MKRYFSLDLEACKNANLDTTEWLFLENIKFVQHYDGNAVSGWCAKSKKALAEHLGISERKVFLMIDELCEKDFLIKHDETGFLKTTKKWDDVCSIPAKNAEPKNVEPMQKMQSDYAKNAEGGMQNLQTPTYKKESKKEKEIDITPNGSPAVFSVDVIAYLNAKAKTNYRQGMKKTIALIDARRKEGFTLDDFKTVIDKKTAQWKIDPKMSAYLRPETLFGTKFESYLNEIVAAPQVADRNNINAKFAGSMGGESEL